VLLARVKPSGIFSQKGPRCQNREFFKVVLESGFHHHAAIVPGDCSEELSGLADMLGIRKLVL